MNLSPLPIQKFFDNAGRPINGGLLFTYVAGTTTKIATARDQAGTLNANPIVLDFRGEANVWLDQTLTYKFVLAPANDTDPPTAPIWSVDNISAAVTYASLTQQIIGQILFPRTLAEINALAIPINYGYPSMYVDRYATNSIPATTPMAAAFNAAIKVAKQSGGTVRYSNGNSYLLEAPLDCTKSGSANEPGFTIRGEGPIGQDAPGGLIAKHTGHVFDLTGSDAYNLENLSVRTDASTILQTCFFQARNSTNSSIIPRITNCRVAGSFSKSLLYNYGAEDGVYVGNYFVNTCTNAGTKVATFTANNILGLSSTFVTIATGAQSCIDHQFFGGQYQNLAGTATSDVFYLEQADSLKLIAPWMFNQSASADGRALVYVDMTNAASSFAHLVAVTAEQSAGFIQAYGVLFSNNAQTPSGWTIDGGIYACRTNAIACAGANPTLDSFTIRGISEPNNRGINVPGTLQNSIVQISSLTLVIGTSTKNDLTGQTNQWTITTRSNDVWHDTGSVNKTWTPNTAALAIVGGLTVNHKRALFHDSLVTVSMLMTAGTSINCAAGTHITGLPVTPFELSGEVVVHNTTTNVRIAGGYVDGTGINLPAIAVGTDSILVTATYWAA